MELPLQDIKVIDFTGVQAGPAGTQLLAWFGADVLKVERPSVGDVTRNQLRDIADVDALYFTMLNSNKRSLELNTKTPEGKVILEKLIREADVLVENFAPGAMDRMGFTWERLQVLNPRLIFGSIKGFSKGSPYADLMVDLQQGEYEELDQMNAAKPYAKAAYRVDRAEDIGIGLARAIRAAVSGRPGGVYLDFPGDALAATLDGETGARSLVRVVDAAPRQLPAPESVKRVLEVLAKAERPLIILGKGAAYAQADADIRAFVEKTGIPFQPMSMAKGLLPDDHPQSTAAVRSYALAHADVVMLIGARLNWLLGHGKSPQWSPTAQFIQLDIEPMEMDSNRAIAAPVVGDIASSVSALLAMLKPGQIRPGSAWLDDLAQHKQGNVKRLAARLAANPNPMDYYSALGAIKGVLADKLDVYLVNDGANTLDIARNVIDMRMPRRRLDSGTWGVMGISMGYAIGAAVVSGKPVVAIDGDSAFGFSGMEIETICRYQLPIVTIVFNNGGIYRGDDVNRSGGADPAPTILMKQARYEKLIEAFGGAGYSAVDPQGLAKALADALASGKPALINCAIDPTAGTESGHIGNLNPQSSIGGSGKEK